MKNLFVIAIVLAAAVGISLTSPAATGSCGVLSLGTSKLDLSKSEVRTEISKASLVDNFKTGLVFNGSSKCPGTYEITDLHLEIIGARDVKYQYDFAFVESLKTMEEYMLVRYFNDALSLNFTKIKVKNSNGEIMELPAVSFTVKS